MKRASISIMSNLAEGNQRKGEKDALNFFNVAFSSLTELDCQSELALDLGYIAETDYKNLVELINKTAFLIFRLIESKNNPNSLKSLQSRKSPKVDGFSLVELLVVISIVALLSAGAVLGFGNLGTTLREKEVVGFLGDTIQQEELKVLRNDLSKARIHFLRDFLVIEEWTSDSVPTLSLDGLCSGSADDKNRKISYSSGNLTQKDGEGNVIAVKNVTAGTPCITFDSSQDLEWNYQLKTEGGAKASPLIRFVHFNLQRSHSENFFSIGSNTGSILEIQSPYGKKRLFKLNSDNSFTESNSLSFEINASGISAGDQFTIDISHPNP
jgi:four helix bundle protein